MNQKNKEGEQTNVNHIWLARWEFYSSNRFCNRLVTLDQKIRLGCN